jgi:hypothetical protein
LSISRCLRERRILAGIRRPGLFGRTSKDWRKAIARDMVIARIVGIAPPGNGFLAVRR